MNIKEVLESIIKNDKTPSYEYENNCRNARDRAKSLYNTHGDAPEHGKRWQTPSEIASTALINIIHHRKEILKDFDYKELQDEIDRRDNEREIEIQAKHDAEMAEEDSKSQAEAEGIAEDNARADQERAEAELQSEAMQAEYEAEMAQG